MKSPSQGKITLLSLLAVILSVTPTMVLSQETKQTPAWLQKEVDKVSRVVPDLNDEQKSKLTDAIKTRTEALAKVKGSGASGDEAKAQTKAVWTTYTHEVKSVLNETQFEKFKGANKPRE